MIAACDLTIALRCDPRIGCFDSIFAGNAGVCRCAKGQVGLNARMDWRICEHSSLVMRVFLALLHQLYHLGRIRADKTMAWQRDRPAIPMGPLLKRD